MWLEGTCPEPFSSLTMLQKCAVSSTVLSMACGACVSLRIPPGPLSESLSFPHGPEVLYPFSAAQLGHGVDASTSYSSPIHCHLSPQLLPSWKCGTLWLCHGPPGKLWHLLPPNPCSNHRWSLQSREWLQTC